MKPEKQSQRSEDREFGTSASSKRTDLGFCALTIVFVRAFGLLTGGYPCFYDGPGPRGRLLGNDDSRVTGNSEVETSPAHATGPEAGIWEVQWTDSRRLALDGKQLRSSLP